MCVNAWQAWMRDQVRRLDSQRIVLDVEQELVLNNELKRLARERMETEAFRKGVSELDEHLSWRLKLDSERMGLERALLKAGNKTTDETVDMARRIVAIKKRQEELSAGPVQLLTDTLDGDLNAQEVRLFKLASFLNDMAKTEWEELGKIEAVLKEPYSLSIKPFDVLSWRESYRIMPWKARCVPGWLLYTG
jgi:hypothetical protein